MSTDCVSEVVKRAAVFQPVERPSPADWRAVESDLGLELPTDFKAIVDALGSGRFGAGLYLRNPAASSEYIRLTRDALNAYRENLRSFERRTGISFYPTEGGLVVVGSIDRDHFYLQPEASVKRLSRLVHLDLDLAQASELHMPVSQFIHELYLNRLGHDWAGDLRMAIWRNGEIPFFTSKAGIAD